MKKISLILLSLSLLALFTGCENVTIDREIPKALQRIDER